METMQNFQKEDGLVSGITEEEKKEIEERMKKILETVREGAKRVAELGEWPEYVDLNSLTERVPLKVGERAPGFDAGIACALNMIPEDKQKLAAMLHAHYTKEAVMQVRDEAVELDPDSSTAWWLAACSVCREGEIDAQEFLKQIEEFKKIVQDKGARSEAAKKEYDSMTSSFVLKDGVPFGEKDGCIQGAYIAGYPFGTFCDKKDGLYFVGTYEESLGLREFPWSKEVDEKGREKSGPVFGSRQFVKCANEDEWKRVMEAVKKKFHFYGEEEIEKFHEEALEINKEVDDGLFNLSEDVSMDERYRKAQEIAEIAIVERDFGSIRTTGYPDTKETRDTIVRKRELLKGFRREWQQALSELPEGAKPTLVLNEKAVANMYMADHLFGKDFTMRNIARCLVFGKEVTGEMKHGREGSRYFKIDVPDGAGMPGRFVLPQESGTTLAEFVANWNQPCQFMFRHGRLSPVIDKEDLPQWLINYESVFYVIVEENKMPDGKLQVADGPSENDAEGSWLVSTVHYGHPSRIKPRLPKEPKWKSLRKDSETYSDAMAQYQGEIAKYLKDFAEYLDEQSRVVFVNLGERGVGQKGIRREINKSASKMPERNEVNSEALDDIAELKNDSAAIMKMMMELQGKMSSLASEIKGLKTKQGR